MHDLTWSYGAIFLICPSQLACLTDFVARRRKSWPGKGEAELVRANKLIRPQRGSTTLSRHIGIGISDSDAVQVTTYGVGVEIGETGG